LNTSHDSENRATAPELFAELDPEPRLLMGPGPVDVYPRVLRAMSVPLQGQFDPQFTGYMNQVMALYRQVFRTANTWTLLIDGTARAGIEACLASALAPGDTLLVPVFGRFGHLKMEIGRRLGAKSSRSRPNGAASSTRRDRVRDHAHRPRMVAISHGDTSTTMLQPLAEIGTLCRKHDVLLYVDCTASLGGNAFAMDAWQIDMASAGLQKCLSGPPGSSPVSFNDRAGRGDHGAKAHRARHQNRGDRGGRGAHHPLELFRPRDADGILVCAASQSSHRGGLDAVCLARMCPDRARGRVGARHRAPPALEQRAARRPHRDGACAVRRSRTPHGQRDGCDHSQGDREARPSAPRLLHDFGIEIGTSFGPLAGKIWRIGTMGYVCRKANVLRCLTALEAVLRRNNVKLAAGAAVDAAYRVYDSAQA
jgi:(S)-ureidoglycine-glyoxylate aminotransferase